MVARRRAARLAALLLGALVSVPAGVRAVRAGPRDGEGMGAATLQRGRVTTPSGASFDVEVVTDPESRARGLKYRTLVPRGTGMIFVFPAAGRHRFWMYECRMSIDILWIDPQRRVIKIAEKVPPCAELPCPDYGPAEDDLYVLEIGPGEASASRVRVGDRLTLLFETPPRPS